MRERLRDSISRGEIDPQFEKGDINIGTIFIYWVFQLKIIDFYYVSFVHIKWIIIIISMNFISWPLIGLLFYNSLSLVAVMPHNHPPPHWSTGISLYWYLAELQFFVFVSSQQTLSLVTLSDQERHYKPVLLNSPIDQARGSFYLSVSV